MLTKKLAVGVFAALLLASCGGKKTVDDIKLDDIKTPCDMLDAQEIYWADYQVFIDKKNEELKDVKELSETEKTALEDGFAKYERVGKDLLKIQLEELWIDKDFYDCKEGRSRFSDLEDMADKCGRRQAKLRGLLSSPEQTATDYLIALKDKDYTKAKELGSKNTQDMLDALTSMDMAPIVVEVKQVKCTVKDDEADCSYCCSKEGESSIHLIKETDRWLVDEKKESGSSEGEESGK